MEELNLKQAEKVGGGIVGEVGQTGHYYTCPICQKKDYKILPSKQLKCNACSTVWWPQ